MFLKRSTKKSIGTFSERIRALKQAVCTADAVVVGAGAGLSAAAGFEYAGQRFQKYFSDFHGKYGFQDMYSGGFYPYQSLEEYWAFWSRQIYVNRYLDAPGTAYKKLLTLLEGKDYFVLTTNVDHCFQKAGFDKQRLFYTQGDYGLWQCSAPCCQKTYDNREKVLEMLREQKDMRIPSALIPYCPVCGRPMIMNLRVDNTFVQDAGWYAAAARYETFLRRHETGKVLYLELGVGANTPGIIKYPFWRMTADNAGAVYACLNLGEVLIPDEIAGRAIGIDGDISAVLDALTGTAARISAPV